VEAAQLYVLLEQFKKWTGDPLEGRPGLSIPRSVIQLRHYAYSEVGSPGREVGEVSSVHVTNIVELVCEGRKEGSAAPAFRALVAMGLPEDKLAEPLLQRSEEDLETVRLAGNTDLLRPNYDLPLSLTGRPSREQLTAEVGRQWRLALPVLITVFLQVCGEMIRY
jgi:hypothetical protein